MHSRICVRARHNRWPTAAGVDCSAKADSSSELPPKYTLSTAAFKWPLRRATQSRRANLRDSYQSLSSGLRSKPSNTSSIPSTTRLSISRGFRFSERQCISALLRAIPLSHLPKFPPGSNPPSHSSPSRFLNCLHCKHSLHSTQWTPNPSASVFPPKPARGSCDSPEVAPP